MCDETWVMSALPTWRRPCETPRTTIRAHAFRGGADAVALTRARDCLTSLFDPVHLIIRMAQQGSGVLSVRGITGHANAAGWHVESAEFSAQWFGHGRENTVHTFGNGVLGVDVRQEDREFVTPHPGYGVGLAYAALQASCNHAQHTIAHQMSMGIIDTLEVIDIQIQQRQAALIAVGFAQGRVQPSVEKRPVGEFCQWVVMGKEM